MTFFGPEVADRVPYMLRTLVYIWTALVVVALALITRPPKEEPVVADFEDFEASENDNTTAMSPKSDHKEGQHTAIEAKSSDGISTVKDKSNSSIDIT